MCEYNFGLSNYLFDLKCITKVRLITQADCCYFHERFSTKSSNKHKTSNYNSTGIFFTRFPSFVTLYGYVHRQLELKMPSRNSLRNTKLTFVRRLIVAIIARNTVDNIRCATETDDCIFAWQKFIRYTKIEIISATSFCWSIVVSYLRPCCVMSKICEVFFRSIQMGAEQKQYNRM